MDLDKIKKIEWSFLEYDEKNRGKDWFWALGVIIVAGSTTSFIYQNYFFGLFLIIGGIMLAVFAIKKPDMVSYELNNKGLKIRNRLYPYENIKAFWVKNNEKPTLFIKSERLFMPIISMPIESFLSHDIREMMLLNKVKEEEMREHFSEKIMEFLDF